MAFSQEFACSSGSQMGMQRNSYCNAEQEDHCSDGYRDSHFRQSQRIH